MASGFFPPRSSSSSSFLLSSSYSVTPPSIPLTPPPPAAGSLLYSFFPASPSSATHLLARASRAAPGGLWEPTRPKHGPTRASSVAPTRRRQPTRLPGELPRTGHHRSRPAQLGPVRSGEQCSPPDFPFLDDERIHFYTMQRSTHFLPV